MSVCILNGKSDGGTDAAAMYCSTTGWMLGPIFEGAEAVEHIGAFLAWLNDFGWWEERESIFVTGYERYRTSTLIPPTDPRGWGDEGLEMLVNRWRAQRVDLDGHLRDECESDAAA